MTDYCVYSGVSVEMIKLICFFINSKSLVFLADFFGYSCCISHGLYLGLDLKTLE